MATPPIYLLDSMAFIFRAYHAMQRQRPMSTRTGIPTAATYVFVNMINKLRKDFSPQYLAAVYDLSGPVFRDEQARGMKDVQKFNIKTQQFETIEYAGYKATRTEMPADLAQQLPYIRRALEAFRIPILSYEGFEADDVIGTLSCQLSALGHKVFVVSSDKDMMQLANEDVSILNPTKDNLILTPKGVEEILGVPPTRVIDVMALRGDSIDNIPGAPGIGDKGSVELIQQFGTVEAALDRAAEVKKKTYRESLQNNRDNILLSKELVTIHTGVPIQFSLDDMRTQPLDNAACRDLFSELEFTTLLKELAPSADNTPIAYLTKPTPAEIAALLTQARTPITNPGAPHLAPEMWVPTTAQLACRLGLSASPNQAIEVSLDTPQIREALEDPTLPKQVHDLKAVLRALAPHSVALRGPITDVMLQSYLVNPTHGSHTLVDIAARTTSRALTHQPTKQNPTDPNRLPEAAAAIHRLATTLTQHLAESAHEPGAPSSSQPHRDRVGSATNLIGDRKTTLTSGSTLQQVYEQIDLPLVPVLLRMEQTGVRIDPEFLRTMSSRLAVTIDDLAERIYAASGHRFNINSPKQLGEILFNQMNLPKPMKYGKGKVVSTAQDVLEELALSHPIAALVIEHRQLQKLKGTYLDALPQLADPEGRIHTTFNQVGTATGRLSSINPNLQNIPIRTEIGREIRAAFIAAPGNILLSADYSQIELRLMAHFSQDPLLLNAYRTGQDIHTLTTSEVFGIPPNEIDKQTRARAKAVNFGIVYGISPFGLAAQLNIPQAEAKLYIETYFDRYKGVRAFIDHTLETVRTDQAVRTAFGRIRPIPDIASRNPNMRGFAERTAVNTPLQGTAADLIKLAMIAIDRQLTERNLRSRMTLQVHDELLFDAPPEELEELKQIVQQEMENVAQFTIPLTAELGQGQNWRDLQ